MPAGVKSSIFLNVSVTLICSFSFSLSRFGMRNDTAGSTLSR